MAELTVSKDGDTTDNPTFEDSPTAKAGFRGIRGDSARKSERKDELDGGLCAVLNVLAPPQIILDADLHSEWVTWVFLNGCVGDRCIVYYSPDFPVLDYLDVTPNGGAPVPFL
jgi:hypothetical protein